MQELDRKSWQLQGGHGARCAGGSLSEEKFKGNKIKYHDKLKIVSWKVLKFY